MPELSPGSAFGGYRIEGLAGRGGMGVVYRATQLGLDRLVAVKLIAPELASDPTFRERFQSESRVAASIDHPNVIPIFEAGEADDQLFLSMRYVEGTDLRTLIQRTGGLEPSRAADIVAQVAAALDAAHRRGLVHRDIKPANVLIAAGQEDHAYLTDFGLTKRMASAGGLTKTGQFVGTIDYISPEQIQGRRSDARSDVYSLGCVLFNALSGQVPYERDSDVAKMYAHISDPPPSVSEVVGAVPREFNEVIDRALAKSPDDRYQSAGDLGRAALAAADQTVPLAPERSVATGQAAPVEMRPDEPTAAATAPADIPPDTPPTGVETPTPPVAAATEEGDDEERADDEGAAAPATPKLPPGRGRRRGRAAVLVAAVVGLGAATGLGVLAIAGGGGGGGGGSASAPQRVRLTVRAPIAVGSTREDAPDGLAFGAGRVWVAKWQLDELIPIRSRSRSLDSPIPVGESPDSVAFADNTVWVTNSGEGTVRRIDAVSRRPLGEPIDVGDGPEGIAIGEEAVWVANSASDTVTRIDRRTLRTQDIPVGRQPIGVAVMTDAVWTTNTGDDTLTRIDPERRTSVQVSPVGSKPRGVAIGEGALWVANSGDGTVSRVDLETSRQTGVVRVGRNPREIAAGLGAIWVTNSDDGTLMRIDPAGGGKAGAPVRVGRGPVGVAVGGGSVWVANTAGRTIRQVEVTS